MRVRNAHGAAIHLIRMKRQPRPDEMLTQDVLDTLEIASGATVDVDEAFLASEGARSLFDEGILVDVELEVARLRASDEERANAEAKAKVEAEAQAERERIEAEEKAKVEAEAESANAEAAAKRGRGAK